MNEDQRRRLAALSSEQRARFEDRLRARGLDEVRSPRVSQIQAPPAVEPRGEGSASTSSTRALQFSVFFFSDDGGTSHEEKYGLVLEAARLADAEGLHAIWTPERHFHPFGGLYANPALLGAAIAATTRRIGIRAGSVVLPLQHPIRVAEEWSMVDNLSGGRVGVSFASGWVPEDFVLATTPFEERRHTTFERLDVVRRLWRGEKVDFSQVGHPSPVPLSVFPRPVQPELPVWITTAGTRETWIQAGRLGLNVLTGLLQSSLERIGENVALYRAARREAGHDPDAGCVTLMIHTYLGTDDADVRARVREPMLQYLRTHLGIYETHARLRNEVSVDHLQLTGDDKDAIAEFAFERYFRESALFGTVESCQPMLARLRASGIDEVGCLVDFGVNRAAVLESLRRLAAVHRSERTSCST